MSHTQADVFSNLLAGYSMEKDAEEMPSAVDKEEKQHESVTLHTPTAKGGIFQNPHTHPYVLDVVLLQKYGPEWMTWESEMLTIRILSDFKTASINDINFQKLQALKTIHLTNAYWNEWHIFVVCTMPLNDMHSDFDAMQVPTVEQAAISVDIVNKIRDGVEWSNEVKTYLGMLLKFQGVFLPIEPLDFVKVDSDNYFVDAAEIAKRWPFVRKTGQAPADASVTSEQLRRVLDIDNALKENRKLLDTQMRALI